MPLFATQETEICCVASGVFYDNDMRNALILLAISIVFASAILGTKVLLAAPPLVLAVLVWLKLEGSRV